MNRRQTFSFIISSIGIFFCIYFIGYNVREIVFGLDEMAGYINILFTIVPYCIFCMNYIKLVKGSKKISK